MIDYTTSILGVYNVHRSIVSYKNTGGTFSHRSKIVLHSFLWTTPCIDCQEQISAISGLQQEKQTAAVCFKSADLNEQTCARNCQGSRRVAGKKSGTFQALEVFDRLHLPRTIRNQEIALHNKQIGCLLQVCALFTARGPQTTIVMCSFSTIFDLWQAASKTYNLYNPQGTRQGSQHMFPTICICLAKKQHSHQSICLHKNTFLREIASAEWRTTAPLHKILRQWFKWTIYSSMLLDAKSFAIFHSLKKLFPMVHEPVQGMYISHPYTWPWGTVRWMIPSKLPWGLNMAAASCWHIHGGFHSHGATPIYGYLRMVFVRENPTKMVTPMTQETIILKLYIAVPWHL